MVQCCILNVMGEVENMVVRVSVRPKALLCIRKDMVKLRVGAEDSGNKTSPKFTHGVIKAKGSVVRGIGVFPFFKEEDSVGVAETSWGISCGPHELKQVVNGSDPGGGKSFKELIVDVVRARCGAIGQFPNT